MNPRPGEIWLADLGLAAKTRPIVIVSREDPDPPRSLVLYVPLTTQRRNSPYEVPLPRFPFLDRESVANVQGLGSLPTVRRERKIGRLSAGIMEQITERALRRWWRAATPAPRQTPECARGQDERERRGDTQREQSPHEKESLA